MDLRVVYCLFLISSLFGVSGRLFPVCSISSVASFIVLLANDYVTDIAGPLEHICIYYGPYHCLRGQSVVQNIEIA